MEEIDEPKKAAAFTQKFLAGADREHFLALSMDNACKLTAIEAVLVGTVNATLAEPREIFKHAILANTAGIVMVHNHTSGRCVPSEEELSISYRKSFRFCCYTSEMQKIFYNMIIGAI